MKRVAITKLTREEKKQIKQERKLTNKNYKVELKELQKRYTPDKINRVYNKDAKKTWMPILKFNCDWDWAFIISVLLYKIELTKLYIKHFGNTIEEERNKKVAEMEEAVKLYKVFTETNWHEEDQKFSNEHVRHYIFLSESFNTKKYKYKIPTDNDSLMFYDLDINIDMIKEEKQKAEAYTYAAGVPITALYNKKLIKSFGAEWDSEENEKHYLDLFKQGEEAEQKALDNFFLYISKHIQGWWD